MSDDDINDIPRNEISDHDCAQELRDARRNRVLDDPTAFPLHMMYGIAGWLAAMPAVEPLGCTDCPIDDMHALHVAELMLAGQDSAGSELMARFARRGGKHWDEAVEEAMDSIPDHVAASDAADAAQEAAEIDETQASLMPGRI